MRGQAGSQVPTTGQGMVGADVFAHPDTSVGEIAERTGLRQGYVSETVARLRKQGVLETSTDPADGRRTLVRLAPGHPAAVSRAAAADVSQALGRALGDPDPAALTEITATLTALARRLQPAEPGPVPRALTRGPGGPDRKGPRDREKETS